MLNESVLFNHPNNTDSVTPATVISIAISIGSNPKICILIDTNCDIYVISWLNRNFVSDIGGERTDKETKDYIDGKLLEISNRIQWTFDMVSRDVVQLKNKVKKLEDK